MKRYIFIILISLVFQCASFAQEKAVLAANENEWGPSGPECGGVERWAVKVLTDAAAPQVNFIPKAATLDSLIHIQTAPNASAPRMAGIEFQTYRMSCYITIKKNEDDNDYHLVLKDGTQTMIGEVPDPVCSAAASSTHVNEYIAARNWVNMNIGILPNSNVNLAMVDITGVSFVDVSHGQTGAAPNQMEIHPILNIAFNGATGISNANTQPAYSVTVTPSVFKESAAFQITSQNDMFGTCRLEVYSMAGGKVDDLNMPLSTKKEIRYIYHRNHLPAGMYIYRILNNGGILYEGKLVME